MRLICPNCGAQYEVASDVIPEEGRDVQCSNCGHTWLETPGASAAAEALALGEATLADTQGDADPDLPPEDSRIVDDIGAAFNDSVEDTGDDADADDPDGPDYTMPPAAGAASGLPDEGQRRSALDGSIADILREEAAREEAARRSEAGEALEYSDDLGLDALPAAAGQRTGNDDVRRAPPEAETLTKAVIDPTAGRGQMFPDIEEINSTLRPSSDRAGDAATTTMTEPAKKSGFGRGFMTSVILVGALVAIYIFAPVIGEKVPALADPMTAYADQIDALRIWLDVKLQGLLATADAG